MTLAALEIFTPARAPRATAPGAGGVGAIEISAPAVVLTVIAAAPAPQVLELVVPGRQGPPGPPGADGGAGEAGDIEMLQDPVVWFNLYANV